jgi:hypothetical protein
MWIVKLALNRPYTFIVLAILILIAARSSSCARPPTSSPTSTSPSSPSPGSTRGPQPEELEGRLTTPYEKGLTTLVDNVEHIESTTYNGQASSRSTSSPAPARYCQRPGHRRLAISSAPAAARHPAAADHQLLRLQRAHPADSASPARADRAAAERHRRQLHPPAAHHRPGRVLPNLRRQAALDHDQPRPQAAAGQGLSPGDVLNASASRTSSSPVAPPRSAQPSTTSNSTAPRAPRRPRQPPGQAGQRHHRLPARCRQRHRRQHPADQHRPPGRPARRAHQHAQVRQRVHLSASSRGFGT